MGVWYVKEGTPKLVLDAKELGGAPDGIAISPDDKYLYLTAGGGHMKRYAIAADGALTDGMMFAEGAGIGDGIKTDLKGNIYSGSGAGPGVRACDGTGRQAARDDRSAGVRHRAQTTDLRLEPRVRRRRW